MYRTNMDALKEETDHKQSVEQTLDPVARINNELRFNKLTGAGRLRSDVLRAHDLRFTRGKCFVQFFPIYHPQRSAVRAAARRLCLPGRGEAQDGLRRALPRHRDRRARPQDLPGLLSIHEMGDESQQSVHELVEAVEEEIQQTDQVLSGLLVARSLLHGVGNSYYHWLMTVRSEKAIYHTMNKCDVTAGGYLNGKGWVPSRRSTSSR